MFGLSIFSKARSAAEAGAAVKPLNRPAGTFGEKWELDFTRMFATPGANNVLHLPFRRAGEAALAEAPPAERDEVRQAFAADLESFRTDVDFTRYQTLAQSLRQAHADLKAAQAELHDAEIDVTEAIGVFDGKPADTDGILVTLRNKIVGLQGRIVAIDKALPAARQAVAIAYTQFTSERVGIYSDTGKKMVQDVLEEINSAMQPLLARLLAARSVYREGTKPNVFPPFEQLLGQPVSAASLATVDEAAPTLASNPLATRAEIPQGHVFSTARQ